MLVCPRRFSHFIRIRVSTGKAKRLLRGFCTNISGRINIVGHAPTHLFVFIVLVMQEKKGSGTCQEHLSEEQCKSGPYPDKSLNWRKTDSYTIYKRYPKGCFVHQTSVYFNTLDSNIGCDKSEKMGTYCLCLMQGNTRIENYRLHIS